MVDIQVITEKVIDLFDANDVSPEEAIKVMERLKVAIVMYRVIEEQEQAIQSINLN